MIDEIKLKRREYSRRYRARQKAAKQAAERRRFAAFIRRAAVAAVVYGEPSDAEIFNRTAAEHDAAAARIEAEAPRKLRRNPPKRLD